MNIPDLRLSNEITLEHCSVLLERIGWALDTLEGEQGMYDVSTEISPYLLLEYYEDMFEPEAFTRLFASDLGKGVLVGTYVQRLFDRITTEEADAFEEG